MKKTRVAKAHGFIPSMNPASRIARTPKDLNRSIIDSSAFFDSSGVGEGEGDGVGVGVGVVNPG